MLIRYSKVCQKLFMMHRLQSLNGFQFHYYRTFYKDVKSKIYRKHHSIVFHVKWHLPLNLQTIFR